MRTGRDKKQLIKVFKELRNIGNDFLESIKKFSETCGETSRADNRYGTQAHGVQYPGRTAGDILP